MVNVTPLHLVCMNDQVFPLWETDAEQIVAMMSALTHAGVEVVLLLPRVWRRDAVTTEAVKTYYEVDGGFAVVATRSAFPCFRVVEKFAHGIRGVFCRVCEEADVLYTRNIPTDLAFLALSRKPVVYETYRPWSDQQPLLRPILRWMTRHRRFLAGVFHSKLAAESFVNNGMPEEKGLVAYNGYDPNRLQPVLTKEAARQAIGVPPDQYLVVYSGTVSLNKGVGILLAMAAMLPYVHFWVVGSRGRNEVEILAEPLTNVRMIPWQQFSASAPYLYAADVLIIPPTPLPLEKVGTTVLPLKTFLYMAANRPIFGLATPDMLEILQNGVNAVLAEPSADLTAICRLLDQLLGDPEQQQRIAARAATDVASFTWANRGRLVRDFLEERLGRQHYQSPLRKTPCM